MRFAAFRDIQGTYWTLVFRFRCLRLFPTFWFFMVRLTSSCTIRGLTKFLISRMQTQTKIFRSIYNKMWCSCTYIFESTFSDVHFFPCTQIEINTYTIFEASFYEPATNLVYEVILRTCSHVNLYFFVTKREHLSLKFFDVHFDLLVEFRLTSERWRYCTTYDWNCHCRELNVISKKK